MTLSTVNTALFLDTSLGGYFLQKTVIEGKAILDKILENTPYTCVYVEFPEEQVETSPEPKEETPATELETPLDSSHELVVEKPPEKGTQTQLEDDDSSLEFPFEFKEDIFEDYGNTSICLCNQDLWHTLHPLIHMKALLSQNKLKASHQS